MDSTLETHHFQPDEGIPNSLLPLLVWKGRLPEEARDGDKACALFERNGWTGTWVDSVYTFWHFHTHGHEVLACVAGTATLGFGGDAGIKIEVEPGDVMIIPAGVGHRKSIASRDFQIAGGYPPGQEGNIVRPGEMEDDRIAREIARVDLPRSDPVTGEGGVVELWSAEPAG